MLVFPIYYALFSRLYIIHFSKQKVETLINRYFILLDARVAMKHPFSFTKKMN